MILYRYVRYHRVSVGNTTHTSSFLVSQFLRSICALVSVSDVARPPIASIVNAFFGFIYRSLQPSAVTDRVCIPSHGSFESSYTLRTRAFVQRHVGSVVCVFVVSIQLILRGLESCSGRTLFPATGENPCVPAVSEDQQPVGSVEPSPTSTSARYKTSFLQGAPNVDGKHLKRNVFLLLLVLMFRWRTG